MRTYTIILIASLLLFTGQSYATIYYWVGNDGNWTDATNHWSTSSGGAPNASNLPTSLDDVYFDANSGTGTVTVSSSVNAYNFYMQSGISSSLNLIISSNGLTLAGNASCYGNIQVSGGTFTTSNGNFYLYGGSLNISSGTVSINDAFRANDGTFTISGGTMYTGTGNNSFNPKFYLFSTCAYNLTGGIVEVQTVRGDGTIGYAVQVESTTTAGTISGTLIKVTATNANYYVKAINPIYSLEINSPGKTATIFAGTCDINGNLTLTSGTFDSGIRDMKVAGDWTNIGGTFNANTQTVTLDGSAAQQILGSATTTFNNLVLNNINGLTLATNASISTIVKNLTFSTGKITLGSSDLQIGSAGVSGSISSASSTKYIITDGTGILKQCNIGTGQRTSVAYPIGINSTSYTPITVTVSGASTVDHFSVRVAQSVYLNGSGGIAYTTDVVDRTWYITEETATGSSLTLTPQWNAVDELTSFTRGLALIKQNTTAWVETNSGAYSGSNPYTITSGAVTSFSPFAIFDATLLPIELIYFEASPTDRTVNLEWVTATEFNNDYFEILRSSDGEHFEPILKTNGKGTSLQTSNYKLIDDSPLFGISYYQLSQHDFDGNITFSEIQSVYFGSQPAHTILFPNPSNGTDFSIIKGDEMQGEEISLSITNSSGEIVWSEVFDTKKSNPITLQLNSKLASGMYIISLNSGIKTSYSKLIVR